jgi:tetratricopeptide (TPR) repeat protein
MQRTVLAVCAACAVSLAGAAAGWTDARLAAQQPGLKRDVPPITWTGCPDARTPREVGPAQRLEAERLAAAATQASILGDATEAANLLAQAAAIDAGSPAIAYRLARAEDDLGRAGSAIAAYCHYLTVAPDAPDAADVRARIDALASPPGLTVPAAAADAFHTGVAAYDAARLQAADSAFGRAALAAPAWADPLYNRGIVRLALDRRDAAAEDLRRYLELNPGAPDFNQVLDLLGGLRGVVAAPYSPVNALAAGLVVPGLGHFITDRTTTGLAFLGAAAGAVVAGLAVQRVRVECLSPTEDGVCPPDQVLDERTERPYLGAGIGVAAAVGIWGAIDAYRGARRGNDRAAAMLRVGLKIQHSTNGTRLEFVAIRFGAR